MRVLQARHMGFCFGVRDAIEATRKVERPARVTVYGELVHNARVTRELEERGFRTMPEVGRTLPDTPEVLITAHGVSDRERRRLEAAGKKIVDTTCPLVGRVHRAARRLQDEGRFVVVIGRRGHVEVLGIVGDLDRCAVASCPEEVETWPAARLGVVCQTTTPPFTADAVIQEIRRLNPAADVRYVDTICRPTRDRQEAVLELLGEVELLVVVGGRNSNNTRQLGLLAESRGVPWIHVQSEADLDPGRFEGLSTVGLTAGTSTPPEVIEAVHARLVALGTRLTGVGGR